MEVAQLVIRFGGRDLAPKVKHRSARLVERLRNAY